MTNDVSLFQRIMKKASKIEPREVRAVLLSFSFVFMLMAAYYILRPVRDALASDWTDTELSLLWNLNVFISLFVVAVYGIAVSRVTFRVLVPGVYAFFAASFLAFYFGISTLADGVLIDKAFYLWVSVFSLFHVSVFWSFMSDLFTKEQSRRLFAFIAAGSSAGALVGPLLPTLLAGVIGADKLLLIAAVMLLLPIPIIIYLDRLKIIELHNEDVRADLSAARIGGKPFAGFKMFVTNPYLLAIGGFILLYTAIGSFAYFEQKNLLAAYSRGRRPGRERADLCDRFVCDQPHRDPLRHARNAGDDPRVHGCRVADPGFRADPDRGTGPAGGAAGGQLRHHPTGPRDAVHRRGPGNALQGQTGD
jgi:AAA family ATP:ADP antiporter